MTSFGLSVESWEESSEGEERRAELTICRRWHFPAEGQGTLFHPPDAPFLRLEYSSFIQITSVPAPEDVTSVMFGTEPASDKCVLYLNVSP